MNTQNLVVQKEKVEERLDGSLGLGCDGLVNGNQVDSRTKKTVKTDECSMSNTRPFLRMVYVERGMKEKLPAQLFSK